MNAQEKRSSTSRINLTRGLTILLTLILLLALGGGLMMTRQAQAQAPQNVESPQANLGTAFTYQGRLENASGPVDGTCDFKFSLWDASSGGAQEGSEQGITGVNVSNGYFSASLNNSGEFGSDAFQGNARYLQIKVKCSGDIDYVLMSGRVALNAAPYALSLMPGATVSSDTTTDSALRAISSASSGTPAGLYGEANSSGGAGVAGWNLSSNGGYGVYGKATSPTGWAVYADGRGYVDDELYVNGELYSDGNFHALSNAEVDGDATVHGDLTWDAKTSYVTVAAAAFHPSVDGYDFTNDGNKLWNVDSASDYYIAPVQLPHGATVTKLTFYWWDGSLSDGNCGLYRIDLAGSENIMATASTYGEAASPNASVDTIIDLATVDNSQYAYYLWLNLPDNLVAAYGVVIEYTIIEPY